MPIPALPINNALGIGDAVEIDFLLAAVMRVGGEGLRHRDAVMFSEDLHSDRPLITVLPSCGNELMV